MMATFRGESEEVVVAVRARAWLCFVSRANPLFNAVKDKIEMRMKIFERGIPFPGNTKASNCRSRNFVIFAIFYARYREKKRLEENKVFTWT